MENKPNNEHRRQRRNALGGNNILLAVLVLGLAAVVLLVLFPPGSPVELPYGELVRLIRQGAPHPQNNADPGIVVQEGSDARPLKARYSRLSDIKIGPTEITGKVMRRAVAPSDGPNPSAAAPDEVTFHTGRSGLEHDGNWLCNLLDEKGFTDYRAEQTPSGLRLYLPMIGMFVALGAVVYFVLQRLGGPGSAMAFGRSRGRLFLQEDIEISFHDVAGIDEAVEELREVVEFLQKPEKYHTVGGRIPRGVLLVGPPGTGKTLLAKAVAGEAGVPFFSLSGADFVEMFVGVGAARVRDMFQQALAKAPCIVFIDELDALGKTRGSSMMGGHDEREQTLNALLVEMDGFTSNNGVIVMAATNRPETLDPALMRPGRFDRHVLVDRPDVRGREAILKVHVQRVKLDAGVDLREVAGITSGFVGADLANLVNEAALLAARNDKPALGMDDLNEAVERVTAGLEKKQRIISKEEKLRVAYHESGHALVAYSLPNTDPVHKVSIIPRGLAALGYTMHRPEGDRYLRTQRELESSIQVLLAGTIAEEIIFDDLSTGAQNDLERATDVARAMVMDFGMSRLGRVTFRENSPSPFLANEGEGRRERSHSQQTAREIDQEIKHILDSALERTRHILETRRKALVALAERLLEIEVVDTDELKATVEANLPSPAIVPGTESVVKRTAAAPLASPASRPSPDAEANG